MEMLNFVDLHLLSSIGVIAVIFYVFYYATSKKQKQMVDKVKLFIKLQEHTNQQLGQVVNELRRSNRYLSDLAGMEPMTDYVPPMPMASSVSSNVPKQSTSQGSSMPYQPNEGMEGDELDNQFKLYVGNIDYAATESELAAHFSQYGQVVYVNIPVNRYTGRARGFGFVTFASKEDAERAMALNGSEFKGRQIQVNFAKERD